MNTSVYSVAVATAMAFACTSANAESFFQIEAGIGGVAYKGSADGLWVQEGFPHKLELTAPAVEVGFTGDIIQRPSWGISWHSDWVWLGTIHTQSLATPSDDNYNTKTKLCNGPCWPLANYMGSGHDQGFIFTIEPHYDVGGWRFGVEAGPYIHRATWSVDVTGWRPTPDAAPVNLHVRNTPKWQVGAVIGASVSRNNFTLAYQYFMNRIPVSATEPYPPIWSGTHLLVAKYKF
jgi:hypothetical protein